MSSPPKGYLGLVLHAHLPYVMAHGRWPHGMDWLSEAATECYIPIVRVLEDLEAQGCSSGFSMGITPVLAEQLRDSDFPAELESYCEERIRRAHEAEGHLESIGDVTMAGMARWWRDYYDGIRRDFVDKYDGDIVARFAGLQDRGRIEVITCGATHGYLPLLGRDTSVQAQVRCGVATYEKHFGRPPRGFWLPECAYRPRYEWSYPSDSGRAGRPFLRKGVDEFLSESGLDYFIVDGHLLKGGKALGVYRHRFKALERLWAQFEKQYEPSSERVGDPTRPYLTSSAPAGKRPVAFFVRDENTGLQVWSGEHGYPGDGWYLDFHKKYFPGGFRFWRVTRAKSDLSEKGLYEWPRAAERIPEHAEHFAHLVGDLVGNDDREVPPLLCCPFDAELFGHWWFEGPEWLGRVLSAVDAMPEIAATPLDSYLAAHPPEAGVALPEGSWGEGGYHFIWLNEWTSWTWTRIYEAEDRFAAILDKASAPAENGIGGRLMRQAARELLLLQSSDWQFLISTWSARDYAELRFDGHLQDFNRLAGAIERVLEGQSPSDADMHHLSETEARDRLFEDIDLEWFRRVEFPPE